MYVPKHFEEQRPDVLHDLMRSHPLAALVTVTPNGLEANHIPFEIDPGPAPLGTLRGHIARANSLWRDFSRDVHALAIFQGPNTYVSPSWYPTKQDTGKVVPTWNYAVVHAHGPLRIVEDPTWLKSLVTRLTSRHEMERKQPWNVSDAPVDYIEKQLEAIVGLEMPIARLTGKWKVSQNRPAVDQAGVVEGLLQQGGESAAAIASLVRRIKGE